MSTTPAPELVSPLSEPERHLHQRLRNRSRVVAEEIENEAFADVTTEENMAEQNGPENEPNMNQYGKPTLEGYGSGVAPPEITLNFEIKSSIIHMVENSVQFHGLLDEDPLSHIARFLRICGTFKIQNCSDDQIRLKIFPFSLRGHALDWLESLPSDTITNWDKMVEQFLLKYFPPDKTAKYQASITGFRTDEDESLHAAWERYKGLLRRCPHHGLNKWLQVQTLFDAQSSQNKQAIDQIAGGDIGTKSPNEAFEVLEKAAKKSFAYNPPRSTPSHKGMHHVDSNTLVTAQLEALSKKFEQLQTELVKAKTKCGTCGGEHKMKYCQQSMMVEDVDFVSRQNNTFGNAYNSGWRNHPNFSCKDGAINQTPPGFDKRPFKQTHPAQPKPQNHSQGPSTSQHPNNGGTVEILLTLILASTETSNKLTEERFQKNEAELRNQKASLQNIKNQVGQLAQLLSERQPGGLPSNTVTNPNAQANAITLRSGKTTQDMVSPSQPFDDETEILDKVHDRQVPARLGEPKPTHMSIHLADRSVKYPRGIVENMLVKIDKFVFPVDFVILDMDEDKSVPLILGRPFLATARSLIDVCTGKLTLMVEDEEVTFDIGKSMKHPQHTDDSVYYIDVCESIVSCHLRETIEKEACYTQLIEKKAYSIIHEEQSTEDQEASEHQETYETVDRKLEPKAKLSVEDPPVLELKELPSHLEYAILDGESQLPVIISSCLSNE
ncbi:uncharacterized protein LOC143623816 [Bidens hawaiensis]|uniref:uncharacterized protein LOC143623816 n=1 Tax=Bidens hawaiensis TaxID=980011 RepID=UPI004049916C